MARRAGALLAACALAAGVEESWPAPPAQVGSLPTLADFQPTLPPPGEGPSPLGPWTPQERPGEGQLRCLAPFPAGCSSIEDMDECLHSRDGRSAKEVLGLKIRGEPCVWCGGATCRSGSSSRCEPFDFLMHGEGKAFGLFHAKLTYRVASCAPGEEAYVTETSTTPTATATATTTATTTTSFSSTATATATATSTSTATVAVPAGLLHVGEDCWGHCNRSSGLCDWCGEGNACCRKGWPTRPPACAGIASFRTSFHECVVPASSLAGQQTLAPPQGVAGPTPAASAPPPPEAREGGEVVVGGVGPTPAPSAPSPPGAAEGQAREGGQAVAGGQQALASPAGAGPTPAPSVTARLGAAEGETEEGEEVVVGGSEKNSTMARAYKHYMDKVTEKGGGGIPGLVLLLSIFAVLGVVGLIGCYHKHGWIHCHWSRHHTAHHRSVHCGGLSCDSAESDEQTSDEETVDFRRRSKLLGASGSFQSDADSAPSESALPRLHSGESTPRSGKLSRPGRQRSGASAGAGHLHSGASLGSEASTGAGAAAEPQVALQQLAPMAAGGQQLWGGAAAVEQPLFQQAAPFMEGGQQLWGAAAPVQQPFLQQPVAVIEGNPPLSAMPAPAQWAPSPLLPAGGSPGAFELRTLFPEGLRVEELEPGAALPAGMPLLTLAGAGVH